MHFYTKSSKIDVEVFSILALATALLVYELWPKVEWLVYAYLPFPGYISACVKYGSVFPLFYWVWNNWLFVVVSRYQIFGIVNLSGEYRGTFTSSYDKVQRNCSIIIQQKWFKILVKWQSENTKSLSVFAGLDTKSRKLIFTYDNGGKYKPDETKLEKHDGCCWIEYEPEDLNKLTGTYIAQRIEVTSGSFIVNKIK